MIDSSGSDSEMQRFESCHLSHAVGLPQVRSPMGNLRAQGRAFMLSLPRPTVPGSSRLSFRLPAGKDAAAHKATLVGVLGPAAARRRLESLVAEAQTALERKRSVRSEWGAIALPGSPADFGKLITEETEKWGKVVKFAGVKAD